MPNSEVDNEPMDWDEAATAMLAGYVIARRAWDPGEIAVFVDGSGRVGRPCLEIGDFSASDWMVLGPLQ